MEQHNNKNGSPWQWQYTRLNYFLVASAFLIVAFIQLATAQKEIIILIRAVAALGSFIAALYFFMNSYLACKNWISEHIGKAKSAGGQIVHTWLIPMLFLIFWIYVAQFYWIAKLYWLWTILSFLGFVLLGIFFQKWRDRISDTLFKLFRPLLLFLFDEQQNSDNKQEIVNLLNELNDADIKKKVEELVRWEVHSAKEISQKQEIDSKDTLNVIDKVVGWVKDLLDRR